MAQYSYNDFIIANKAPKNAHHIGVYTQDGVKVGNISLGGLQSPVATSTPIYKFGLLSDIHVDTTDYNYSQYINAYPYSDEGEGDFRRALMWLRDEEQVNMVCACGDMSQNGTTSEFSMPRAVIDEVLPEDQKIPFYTCTGNHDVRTAGGNGFGNYFLRDLERMWSEISNFTRSDAFNESFCFDKEISTGVYDHFIFFSMYSYSLGSSASPYLDADITWLHSKLETWKNERVFLFTHLFFPDYAGNLGRVGGSGGIYPSGNWLGGSQLNTLLSYLERYKNVVWFSGHSHWKWDLQKYQPNTNIARYGDGAWTVHVPSCALPIDSDYTSTSSETSSNRVEKPLQSQGAVVYVYPDYIEIRGIDFNKQNGSEGRGESGTEHLKYLPIANYVLPTTLQVVGGEGEVVGPPVEIDVDNLLINISGNRTNNTSQIISTTTIGDRQAVSVEFTNSNQSCILTDESLTSTASSFRIAYDAITVQIKDVTTGDLLDVNVNDVDNYLGWLVSYNTDTQTSVYSLDRSFDYTYNLQELYSSYKYGEAQSTASDHIGIQLNASSKLSNSASPCWIDNYVTPEQRATFAPGTESTFHIVVTFVNLRIANVTSGGEIDTPSTYTPIEYSELENMQVGESIDVVMANPHRNNGYILGHNTTNQGVLSHGNGFATIDDLMRSVDEVASDDNYKMVIAKRQDMTQKIDYVDHPRTFTVTNGNKAAITTDFVKTTSSISGYDLYTLTTSFNGKNNGNQTNTATAVIDFDGMEFPRTVYIKLLYSSNNGSTSTFTLNGTQATKGTNNTLTSLSNFTSVQITGGVTNGSISLTNSSRSNKTSVSFSVYVLVPNNIVEQEEVIVEAPDGDPYYTISSKNGNFGPTGTTNSVSWSQSLMQYSVSNPTSLSSSTDLTSGIQPTSNPNLIRFTNPSNYHLNAGGGVNNLKFATGQGEWSVWYLLNPNSGSSSSNFISKSNFEPNNDKGGLTVDSYIQDLPNGYVAVSLSNASTGFWVSPPNMVDGSQPTLHVSDMKVYSGLNTTTGTPIALPQYIGFYEGNNHTGADRYQIAEGFQPSYTETNSNGRLQFQTSSSYTGGPVTVVMKISFTY